MANLTATAWVVTDAVDTVEHGYKYKWFWVSTTGAIVTSGSVENCTYTQGYYDMTKHTYRVTYKRYAPVASGTAYTMNNIASPGSGYTLVHSQYARDYPQATMAVQTCVWEKLGIWVVDTTWHKMG